MRARERGAKIIHVDPRFGRTSASADMHVPIRAGTDIAFLGGIIRHVLETESYFKDYVLHYTNASTIISDRLCRGPISRPPSLTLAHKGEGNIWGS